MRRQVWLPTAAILAAFVSASGAVEKGSEHVSPFFGSFVRSIPIEVPEFRGLEPQLVLAYSSEGRNGPVGVGWNLTGFGEIERVNAGGGTPAFDGADTYSLEGQLLVACQVGSTSASCASGGTHSTKVETFLKIRLDPASNTWSIWGKDGTRTVFSPTYTIPGYPTVRWGKTSSVDTRGNTVTYAWSCPGGTEACRPSSITYNGYRVDVFYEPRPDVRQYSGVLNVLQDQYRARTILVSLAGAGNIRAYRLGYVISPVSGRSLLSSVRQYGKDVTVDAAGSITGGTSLSSVSLTYQSDQAAHTFVAEASAPPTAPGSAEPVIWTNRVQVSAWEAGNSLYKGSGSGEWNAGAVSTRSIVSGDGYVQVRAAEGGIMVGLSNGDSDQSNYDIDFALYDAGGGQLYASENGNVVGPFPVIPGDVLRVEVQGGVVRYKRNSGIFYTSARTPTYPLSVDTSIRYVGTVIHDVLISGAIQQTAYWCPVPDQSLTGDFNGDGFTDDLCYRGANGGTTQVALGTAAGFAPPATWLTGRTFSKLTLGDFNADGKTDVADFDVWYGTFAVGLSTGSAFGLPTAWGTASAFAPNGQFYACRINPAVVGTGDFNGDGLTDVSCKVSGHSEIFVGLSNGTSGFAFSIFSQLGCDTYERTGTLDFDGDGKDDWYCMGLTYPNTMFVLRSTGSAFAESLGTLNYSFCTEAGYVLGDFNGDGRTDAACLGNGKVALSTGRLFVQWAGTGPWCSAGGPAFATDVDGDGTSEIVCNNPGAGANDIEVRKWQHTGFGAVETWKAGWCAGETRSGDFNGDGKADLLCTSQPSPVATGGTGGLQSDLVSAVATPLGASVQVAYAPSTGGPAGQPMNGPPTKQVVGSLTTLDGRGGSSTTTFRYFGGYMNRAERQFMGFRVVDEVKPCLPGESSCPYVRTYLRQDLAAAGRPEYVQHYVEALGPTQQEWYEYQTSTTLGVSSAVLSGEWTYVHDLNGCGTWPCPYKRTYAAHQYDAFGNRIQTVGYGDYDAAGDEATDVWTYRPNTTAYVVDRVARSQRFVGVGSAGARLSESQFHYDGAGTWDAPPQQGYETQVRRWLDRQDRYVSRTAGYDAWGNQVSQADETNRVQSVTYDSTFHVFPVSRTNGAGETETATWDPVCQLPLQETDANGQGSTIQTDALCRPIRVDTALGAFEAWDYVNWGDPASQYIRFRSPSPAPEDGSGDSWSAEYLDGLGRVYQSRAKGPSTGQAITVDLGFDVRGNLASLTAPYYAGQPSYATTFGYDSLDRPVLTHLPDGRERTRAYGLWSRTDRDEHGHEETRRYDGHGVLQRTEKQHQGQVLPTTFENDVNGRRVGMIDPVGNHWTWSVDSLGRTDAKNDPDAGGWRYEFDDAGRLTATIDAKNQRTDFTYDAAGRPASRTTPEGTVTLGWSEARAGFFNVGRLTRVQSAGTALTSDYDALGRRVRDVRTLAGSAYQFDRRYDSGGRLKGTTYPDGDSVGTAADPIRYDASGRMRSIPGVLTSVSYDASGRPLTITLGNGLVTTRSYGPERGLLAAIQTPCAPKGCSPAVQDLSYGRDEAGLVTGATSAIGLESWMYGYDDLHRLTDAINLGQPAESQTWVYDEIDRPLFNSRAGSYSYGPTRPHAPTSVGASAFSYDANGNVLQGGGRTLQWNADNRPVVVNTSILTYDGDGARLSKTTGSSTTLYPLGDDYEIKDGAITKYVSLPGLGVVAKRTAAQTFWLHTDGLGSIQAVTDYAGAVVQRRTYRPYGDRIQDATSHVESRGYIGERQDETGLSYLHARYYDPAVGLFVSPDPLGPDADANAFAYAGNDPVNFLDPSGLDKGCKDSSTDSSATVDCDVDPIPTNTPRPDWTNTGYDPGSNRPDSPSRDQKGGGPGGGKGGSGETNTNTTDTKTPDEAPYIEIPAYDVEMKPSETDGLLGAAVTRGITSMGADAAATSGPAGWAVGANAMIWGLVMSRYTAATNGHYTVSWSPIRLSRRLVERWGDVPAGLP